MCLFQALQNDPDFQRIIKTSHRPPTSAAHGLGKLGRGPIVPPSSLGRLGTGAVGGPGRPMTAMNSAGFTASGKRGVYWWGALATDYQTQRPGFTSICCCFGNLANSVLPTLHLFEELFIPLHCVCAGGIKHTA